MHKAEGSHQPQCTHGLQTSHEFQGWLILQPLNGKMDTWWQGSSWTWKELENSIKDMPVLHSVSDPIKRIADDNVHNAQNHKKTVKEIWNVLQKANIGEHHHQSCLVRHYPSAHSSVLEECAPSCPDPAQQVSQPLKPLQEKINGKAPQQKLHDVEKDKRSLCALSASPHPIQRPIQIYKPRMQGKPLPLSQPPYSHLYL